MAYITGRRESLTGMPEINHQDLPRTQNPGHRAAVWAAITDAAAGQASTLPARRQRCRPGVNVNNGDQFRWSELRSRLGAFFDLDVATPLRMPLPEIMADKEPLWNTVVAEHDLQPVPYAQVSPWEAADGTFCIPWDFLADTTKLRTFGFHGHISTEKMFAEIFTDLRHRRIIPIWSK